MKSRALYLRSIIFGVMDSLVSTVSFLAGINVAGVPTRTIALTGIVYIIAEAFSMAVGNSLSEESAEEYTSKRIVAVGPTFIAGIVMFFASVLAALIPLAPYLIFTTPETALVVSSIASIVSLFVVGLISARLARLPSLWRGVRMVIFGGAAILLGVTVGWLVPSV